MEFQEFQVLSMRTMPFKGMPQNKQELDNILGNYALGLLGEWQEYMHEVSHVNINEDVSEETVKAVQKELGDVGHYLAGIFTLMNEEFNVDRLTKEYDSRITHENLANIGECIKKFVYHGHDLNKEKIVSSAYKVASYIHTAEIKSNLENILQKNIDKLKIRYPDKFNIEDSIARVDV